MVLVKAKGRSRAYDPGGVSTAPLTTAIPPPAFLRKVTIYSPNQCTKREDEQDDEGFPNRMKSPDERNDTKRDQSDLLPTGLPPSRSLLLRPTSRRLKLYRPPCRVTPRTAVPRPEGTQPLGPRWTRQWQGRVDSEWRHDNGFKARFRERRLF